MMDASFRYFEPRRTYPARGDLVVLDAGDDDRVPMYRTLEAAVGDGGDLGGLVPSKSICVVLGEGLSGPWAMRLLHVLTRDGALGWVPAAWCEVM